MSLPIRAHGRPPGLDPANLDLDQSVGTVMRQPVAWQRGNREDSLLIAAIDQIGQFVSIPGHFEHLAFETDPLHQIKAQ